MSQRLSERPHADTLRKSRRLVVKVGSALLKHGGPPWMRKLASQIFEARDHGRQVALVSSGAIALGLEVLGLSRRPNRLGLLQAAAAAGQLELLRHWRAAFAKHDVPVAQVLLTHGDLVDRERFLNARHALAELLKRGILPVANENDTVATEEIRVGDNDHLSALVASLIDADLLVLLTTSDGLHDADPERHARAQRIALVHRAQEVTHLAGKPGRSGLGTGGMRTKIEAATSATSRGIPVVIAHGDTPNVLRRLLDGEDLGTLFLANGGIRGRKHWINFALKPAGLLRIDDGAVTALVSAKKSLLPAGLQAVEGDFARGALVEIAGRGGVVARGLAAYAAEELRRIAGCNSRDVARILGYVDTPEIVHRDDMVLVES